MSVSKGQAEDSGDHPCGVCRKGVRDNSILCVTDGFIKREVASQISWGIMWTSIAGDVCLFGWWFYSGSSDEWGSAWAQGEGGVCNQIFIWGVGMKCVGRGRKIYWAYNYLGPFRVLWVHMVQSSKWTQEIASGNVSTYFQESIESSFFSIARIA